MTDKKKIEMFIGTTAFIVLIGLLCYSLFTESGKAEIRREREYQREMDMALKKSKTVQRQVFCEEYRKFGNKGNTPYAYKDCLEKESQ